ncbi:MAG TPA: hypothetical protein VGE72_25650 [Azospirillum sp.]
MSRPVGSKPVDGVDVPTLPPEEVAAIAEHEHLTLEEAAERAVALMSEPYGDAAIRQIVWDNLVRARQHQDPDRIHRMTDLYTRTCQRHPSPCDRRLAPVRETHPFTPPETTH